MAPACGRRSALAERRGRKWRRWRPGRRRRAATARARTPSVRAGASLRASTPKWRCWPSTCSSRCPRTGRSRPGLSWRRWPTCRPSSVSPRAPSALSTCPGLSAPSLPSDEPHHSLSSIAPNIPYYLLHHGHAAPTSGSPERLHPRFHFSSLSDWSSILPHP